MNPIIQARIFSIVQIQFAIILVVLSLGSWIFYKVALKDLSKSRHKLFATLFHELRNSLILGLVSFGTYLFLRSLPIKEEWLFLTSGYVGLLCIFFGANIFIKIVQVMANEYFFFYSKKAGVPLLLVNIASLILFLIICAWAMTYFFDVKVTSVLATSAVLTIVLGLAMQETLGNLFAAISLQIDKPFAMDDWIELHHNGEIIAGQVKELSWRATLLQSMTDEMITIPNRTISQWQIINFSGKTQPFLRGQSFRFPHSIDIELARKALREAIEETPGMLLDPKPLVLVRELDPSWILIRAIYASRDYGSQYILADVFYGIALKKLAQYGLTLAKPQLEVAGR